MNFSNNAAERLQHRLAEEKELIRSLEITIGSVTAYIRRCLHLILWGSICAAPGYWILGEDFMAAVGIFYTSQPDLMLTLLRQMLEIACQEGPFDRHGITALGPHEVVSLAYAYTCAFMENGSGIIDFLVHALQLRGWRDMLLLCSISAWFVIDRRCWPSLFRLYRDCRRFDDNATIMPYHIRFKWPRWALRQCRQHIQLLFWDPYPYVYEKLNHDMDFRLLKLTSAPGDGRLNCTICLLSDLGEEVNCKALSYVWGDASRKQILMCPTGCLRITQNLYDALQQLQKDNYDGYFWIDAVCINQSDIPERNQQVQMMGFIYENVDEVLVWLGPTSQHDCEAFDAMEWIAEQVDQHLGWPEDAFTVLLALSVVACGINVTHISRMLTRPWFERIWVIQEVAKARYVVMRCGDASIPFHRFFSAFRAFNDAGLFVFAKEDTRRAIVSSADRFITLNLCRTWVVDQSIDLFTTLCRVRGFKSTDPRDKIYGLVGMMQDSETLQIIPDYSKSWIETFQDVAITDIVIRKQLRFLSCTSYSSPPAAEHPGLPSWVPDWSRSVDRPPFVAWPVRFKAAGTTQVNAQVSSNNKILTIRGKLLATIERTATAQLLDFVDETDADPSHRHAGFRRGVRSSQCRLAWLENCQELAFGANHRTPQFDGAEDYDEAFNQAHDQFLHILICDTDYNDHDIPIERISEFKRLCIDLPQMVRIFTQWVNTEPADYPPAATAEEIAFVMDRVARCDTLFRELISLGAVARKFCRTKGGQLGYVPLRAEAGDAICLLYGGKVLHVLRPDSDGDDTYSLIGECYIDGFMYGEALEMEEIGAQDFHIR